MRTYGTYHLFPNLPLLERWVISSFHLWKHMDNLVYSQQSHFSKVLSFPFKSKILFFWQSFASSDGKALRYVVFRGRVRFHSKGAPDSPWSAAPCRESGRLTIKEVTPDTWASRRSYWRCTSRFAFFSASYASLTRKSATMKRMSFFILH